MIESNKTKTEATLEINDNSVKWHEVSISLVDNDGNPVSESKGMAVGRALFTGESELTPFDEIIDLKNGRLWAPFLAGLDSVKVELSGLPGNVFAIVSINSWSAE